MRMKSKIINIDNIGDVLFERSKRAKHINISIKPFKGVRVAVPYRVSFTSAIGFVYNKIDWIRKHVEKMKKFEEKHNKTANRIIIKDVNSAKKRIEQRINELAKTNGFTYNKVTIRNQKTKWGSCSTKNNISLNIKLVTLPNELMDYVIFHELVHTKEKNHSKCFWAELEKYVSDAKALDKRLNKYLIKMAM